MHWIALPAIPSVYDELCRASVAVAAPLGATERMPVRCTTPDGSATSTKPPVAPIAIGMVDPGNGMPEMPDLDM